MESYRHVSSYVGVSDRPFLQQLDALHPCDVTSDIHEGSPPLRHQTGTGIDSTVLRCPSLEGAGSAMHLQDLAIINLHKYGSKKEVYLLVNNVLQWTPV